MDPVFAIFNALASSAIAGASRVAKDIVPDAYKYLKHFILRRNTNLNDSGSLLGKLDAGHQAHKASLIHVQTEAGTDKDIKTLLANNLNNNLDIDKPTDGNIIYINGGELKSAIQNNSGNVTQTFY